MADSVLFKVRGSIVLLTLNRPEKLNALDYEMIDLLMDRLNEVEEREDIRGVILTGAGDRAFSAGADIAGFAPDVKAGPEVALRNFVRRGQALTKRIETFPKPVLVAVNGLAHGGGSEITEAAPLALASDRAEFCKAEIRLGFAPPFGGSQRLPRLIGRKRAMQMLLSGEAISAVNACEFGLVNGVVKHSQLINEAVNLMQRITAHSPLAVAACLGSVTRGINVPIDEGLEIEAGYFARMVPTRDTIEGITAFLEKREPHFVGR